MPTTLIQARVGSGKTESALAYLSRTLHDPNKPFARVWVLLATGRQELAFRQRLVELQDNHSVYFNAEFFDFYALNTRLLNLAGTPARKISDLVRHGILQSVLSDLDQQGELPFFAPIAATHGFRQTLADLIYEFKQNLIEPQAFAAAAMTEKDHEVARIYERYQYVLQTQDLVDLEGEGWLALEALQQYTHLASQTDLLLVDGYDQFSPVQAATLAQLALQIPEVVITLTQPDQDDAARSMVIGKRFRQARNRLLEAHVNAGAQMSELLAQQAGTARPHDLEILAANIFSNQPLVPTGNSIYLLEAPDPREETAALLRIVKRMLLDGVKPDDILIAVRDWGRYHTHFETLMRVYDLPLLLHVEESLANNPVVDLLITVLNLVGDHPDSLASFRRHAVLDVLRSPYVRLTDCTAEWVDLLDMVSRKYLVIGGRQQWLDALAAAEQSFQDDEEEEATVTLLDHTQHSILSAILQDFFELLIMPESATIEDYIRRVELLIGKEVISEPGEESDPEASYYSLNIPEGIQDSGESIMARDVAALQQFREILRGMLETEDFMRRVLGNDGHLVRWTVFRDELIALVQGSSRPQRNPSRSGRVLVTTATNARGLPHLHVLIPGLSESIFPAQVSEDPIYLDSERQAFQARGIPLQTMGERADDNGIFYELISLPRATLTLSRPYVREGKPWVESHLWRMVQAVFSDLRVKRIHIGEPVLMQEIGSIEEAVVLLASYLSRYQDASHDPEVRYLYHWIRKHPDAAAIWTQVEAGIRAESARLSTRPHDSYSGMLENPERIQQLADEFGDTRKWSATAINDYGICPFRFFSKRILHLEAMQEPEIGADNLQLGTIRHEILEQTYRVIREEGLAIVEENREEALAILNELAPDILRTAPARYHFRASAAWNEEREVILNGLREVVAKDFSADSPLNTFGSGRRILDLELAFGMAQPLQINADGQAVRVQGKIDRVDVTADNKLIVVDYKSGSTGIHNSEIESGRNVQMLVYLEALAVLYEKTPYEVAGGLYWHISDNSHSGKLEYYKHQSVRDAGKQHIRRHLTGIQQGIFIEQPAKISDGKCTSYCEYFQLCRLQVTNQYKGM